MPFISLNIQETLKKLQLTDYLSRFDYLPELKHSWRQDTAVFLALLGRQYLEICSRGKGRNIKFIFNYLHVKVELLVKPDPI